MSPVFTTPKQVLDTLLSTTGTVVAVTANALRIDIDRLLQRLLELGEIGAIDGTTGCARLALTDEDRAGRDLVRTWMATWASRSRSTDRQRRRHHARLRPGVAPVVTGSHIDTVGTGGRYDGNLGVLAGLEVIETVLHLARRLLERPLAVGWFTDEEGARFPPDMLGSLVYVGAMPLEDALEIDRP